MCDRCQVTHHIFAKYPGNGLTISDIPRSAISTAKSVGSFAQFSAQEEGKRKKRGGEMSAKELYVFTGVLRVICLFLCGFTSVLYVHVVRLDVQMRHVSDTMQMMHSITHASHQSHQD